MKNFKELAAEAAEALKEESGGSAETEFIAWLRIALQREAMVSVAYKEERVKEQLDAWAAEKKVSADVVSAILRALVAVWAQENGHQAYFKAMIDAIAPPKRFMDKIDKMLSGLRGRVQGAVMSSLLSHNDMRRLSAKIAIIIGTMTTEVPEYVQALHKTNFSKYCSINADLEYTAIAGYERMIELARQVPEADFMADTPVIFDLIGTEKDEKYHEELFRRFSEWPPDPPPAGTGPSHSPFAPATAESVRITVADVRVIIAKAKQYAYGTDATALGEKIVAVNEQMLFNDPLIQQLRAFARQAVEGKAQNDLTVRL